MCGIAGFVTLERSAADSLAVLQRMTRALAHRGPDSEGYWQGAQGRVNLGHRRLAIIDLSAAGHQPMVTARGDVISYNGEIYNFPELREELVQQGARFNGGSDTEILLQGLVVWGLERTLQRLNGMFAFAFWNSSARQLVLARDRFGEKPLFYSWQKGVFLFGSELKALTAHPAFDRALDRSALSAYLRFNYVPGPHCIYRKVHKLPPGHYLTVDETGAAATPKLYWELRRLVEERTLDSRSIADPSLVEDTDRILTKAVGQRMLADVPLGAFLSGGLDSSAVVALMQKQSRRPVKTFTIGFADARYDEAQHASAVARHLGTEHHEFYVDSAHCLEVIQQLPEIYDEPFADSSQIPTTLVSLLTREHVTVALSGDAGDELFAGYNRHIWTQRLWPLLNRIPFALRRSFAALTQVISADAWDRIAMTAGQALPRRLQVRRLGEKLHKFSDSFAASDLDALYRSYVSQWQDPSSVLPGATEARTLLDDAQAAPIGLNPTEKMMFLDLMTYLPSDILTKIDRASMFASLEARVPFLDNDVVRFAWSLPLAAKLNGGVGKWPLRQVLKRYVPEALFERPKTGFTIPLGEWLRGPLRDWAEALLSEPALQADGLFNVKVVRERWLLHLTGRRNLQHSLWSILMFQAWSRRQPPTS